MDVGSTFKIVILINSLKMCYLQYDVFDAHVTAHHAKFLIRGASRK